MSHPDHSASPDHEPTQAQPAGDPSQHHEHTQYGTPQYAADQYPANQYGNGQYGANPYGTPAQGQFNTTGPVPTGQFPASPYGQQNPGQQSGRPGGGFLKALFDTTFTRFVTPSMVRVLYILSMICIGLYWISSVILLFAGSHQSDYYGGSHTNAGVMTMAVLDLLFGWILALLALAFVRMQFEFVMALIRTSEYARDIKTHLTGSSTPNL